MTLFDCRGLGKENFSDLRGVRGNLSGHALMFHSTSYSLFAPRYSGLICATANHVYLKKQRNEQITIILFRTALELLTQHIVCNPKFAGFKLVKSTQCQPRYQTLPKIKYTDNHRD